MCVVLKKHVYYALFPFVLCFIVACGEDVPIVTIVPTVAATIAPTEVAAATPTPPLPPGPLVSRIELMILESFPVRVNAIVYGSLPDRCTSIASFDTLHDGNKLLVNLNTVSAETCEPGAVPYEQIVQLNVEDLAAGKYIVDVEGVKESFEFTIDNFITPTDVPILPTDTPLPTLEPTEIPLITISGMIWDDLCDTSEIVWGEPLPDGCLSMVGGRVRANGEIDPDESGIPGVLMAVGKERCSGETESFMQVVSDENGRYTFPDLEAGTWCVYIDIDTGRNVEVLQMGNGSSVTAPTPDRTGTTVTPERLSAERVINFGWDYDDN